MKYSIELLEERLNKLSEEFKMMLGLKEVCIDINIESSYELELRNDISSLGKAIEVLKEFEAVTTMNVISE